MMVSSDSICMCILNKGVMDLVKFNVNSMPLLVENACDVILLNGSELEYLMMR